MNSSKLKYALKVYYIEMLTGICAKILRYSRDFYEISLETFTRATNKPIYMSLHATEISMRVVIAFPTSIGILFEI